MKNKYKDNFNLKVLEVLEFFIKNPYQEIYLRELARKLRINPNTIQRFAKLFIKEGLIKEEKKANLRYFKANLESNTFRHIKIAYSIKEIEKSNLLESLKTDSTHVVLFGSTAEGKDFEESDIDLVIIGNKDKINPIISKYQLKLGKEISPHIFSWIEWKRQAKINKAFYIDVITKGISLIGEKPVAE